MLLFLLWLDMLVLHQPNLMELVLKLMSQVQVLEIGMYLLVIRTGTINTI